MSTNYSGIRLKNSNFDQWIGETSTKAYTGVSFKPINKPNLDEYYFIRLLEHYGFQRTVYVYQRLFSELPFMVYH